MASREEVLSAQEVNLKAVADAIRDKDGTNGLISPLDFPSRIRAISTTIIGEGGGLPAGGSINQALMKNSGDDGDVRWGNVVVTFNGRSGFVYPQEGDYTADDVGAVPTYRSVNNHALEADIWLTADDVDAVSNSVFNQQMTAINSSIDTAKTDAINQSKTYVDSKVSSTQTTLESKITNVQSSVNTLQSSMNGLITYGTTALSSGVSSLATGSIYVQYE